MNSLIGNKIKRIFAVGLLLLLSFSAVSQSLVGSWYEDSLHERSRFRNYFYRLNDTQLSVIDKKHNNAEVFFDYKIRDDYIIITSTGQSSPKISAGTFPITIKNENYFTIHFSTPLSFVRNSYAKEQAVDATKKAAIVAAAGYGAAIVGAVGGKAIAPAVALATPSANAATNKKVAAEKAVVGAGSDSPTTATADKKVAGGTRLTPRSKAVAEQISTINARYEGKRHPETNIPYKHKEVMRDDGSLVSGVFPVFNSKYDAVLPPNLYQGKDDPQFAECNRQLKAAVEKSSKLAKKFTKEQLEQIKNGDTPDGYLWHHNEETGIMQLVDFDIHATTRHTGGKKIWGGGSENR